MLEVVTAVSASARACMSSAVHEAANDLLRVQRLLAKTVQCAFILTGAAKERA